VSLRPTPPRTHLSLPARLLAGALALTAAACGDDQPGTSTPTPDPTPPVEPGTPEPPQSPWPADVVALTATLQAFDSVAGCEARLRAGTPVELAEAMADLGYDSLVTDVCASLEAIRQGSPEGCEGLSVSTARRGCLRRLALVSGEPSLCPDDATIPGREPVCIAWAARDPALCRGAARADGARCRAVLDGSEEACERAITPEARVRCEAEVRRYASAVGEERTESGLSDLTPRMVLTASPEGVGAEQTEIRIERDVLERGVHLAAAGCAYRVELRDPLGELPSPVAFTERPATATLAFEATPELELPGELRLGVGGASVEVLLPGLGRTDGTVGGEGSITLTRWEPRRGAALEGRVSVDLTLTPGRVEVSGDFVTFVRDLDPLPERCGRANGAEAVREP